MAFLAPPPSTQSLLRSSLFALFPRTQNQFSFQSTARAACRRPSLAKPLSAESERSKSVVPLAAKVASPGIVGVIVGVGNNIVGEDYEKLAKELETASPLQIMEKALDKFGNDIAIAYSGAENFALVEYATITGRPFRVFSLEAGRLNLRHSSFSTLLRSTMAFTLNTCSLMLLKFKH